ncbi:hypothetical protein R6U76_03065 [Lysinibacillus capsici]|uniref:hypothetical protein n=1 Tax=Lysinibacillus capsici TaxID=2115968 RepID=UPI0029DE902C|nr:hypothetical protein [Lysinibacillus capsici]WPK06052.1 hypothetical protein R6U76_03065 [Lysinibacillus capsici]
MREKLIKYTSILGIQLVILVGLTTLLSSLLLFVNIEINGAVFIIAWILSIIFSFLSINRIHDKINQKIKCGILLNFIFIIIISTTLFISGKYFDISHDGQMYHQEAIIQLQEGWNPIYDDPLDEINYTPFFWINHYAKGSWFYGATLYDLLGNVEYGKSINIILLVASILLSFSTILRFNNSITWASIFSILLAFNPVTINQMLTFYIDGQLYSLFLLLVVLLTLHQIEKSNEFYLPIILTLALLINIKFTALGYALILCTIPLILTLYQYIFVEKIRDYKLLIKITIKRKINIILITGIVLGIFGIGFSSYVSNMMDHGHPFYPLAGNGSVDIITENTPVGLRNLNKIEQLYLSIFSETSNSLDGIAISKFPLKITEQERSILWIMDVRIGGFGPLFGGIIIIMSIGILLWKDIFVNNAVRNVLLITSVIIFTIIINPEIWWARYVPQMWMLPIIFLILLTQNIKGKLKGFYIICLSLLIGLNCVIMLKTNYNAIALISKDLTIQLETMSEFSKSNEIIINMETFKSNRKRFDNFNINYIEVDNLSCEKPFIIPGSISTFCTNNPDLYNQLHLKNYQKYQ